MKDPRVHPEAMADRLCNDPWLSSASDAATVSNPVACLSYKGGGKFRLSWSSSSPGTYDWVGLYKSTSDPDSDYVSGAWQWVSKGAYFDTSVEANSGYQARYLVWNYTTKKYESVARSGAFPSITVRSVSSSYPRKPTSSEWTSLLGVFPSLNYADVWVTGPSESTYNCIAWSLGYDDRWINPISPLSSFIHQYQTYGRKSVGALATVASIDGWGTSAIDCTHGSKRYTGVPLGVSGLWESKLGQSLRITHSRQGLDSAVYGHIIDSFQMGFSIDPWEQATMATQKLWSEDDERKFNANLESVSDDTKEAFEKGFADWEDTWFKGTMEFSSDTKDRATGEEFATLVAMGTSVIPLVVEKLRDPHKFIALVLYEALQTTPELILTYENVEDPTILMEGEQMRAQRTARHWLDSQ